LQVRKGARAGAGHLGAAASGLELVIAGQMCSAVQWRSYCVLLSTATPPCTSLQFARGPTDDTSAWSRAHQIIFRNSCGTQESGPSSPLAFVSWQMTSLARGPARGKACSPRPGPASCRLTRLTTHTSGSPGGHITHQTSDITKNSYFQHPFFMSRIEFSSSEELEPKCGLHAACLQEPQSHFDKSNSCEKLNSHFCPEPRRDWRDNS
jgi:hypothetical protein